MNKKYTIVGLLLLFLWMPFSFAQEASLKKAKKLFKNNKIQESAKIFLHLANEREDAEAFYHLGRIFSEGLGGIKPQRRVGFETNKAAIFFIHSIFYNVKFYYLILKIMFLQYNKFFKKISFILKLIFCSYYEKIRLWIDILTIKYWPAYR